MERQDGALGSSSQTLGFRLIIALKLRVLHLDSPYQNSVIILCGTLVKQKINSSEEELS